ncbi:MAG: DUF5011 domain-containing protein, partial [Vicinamibacterales bacterium]|nr:DUF5011 domain-containing protein [Vicinamibacterales bacterium]
MDSRLQQSTASFTVTVFDGPPDLIPPLPVTVTTTDPAGIAKTSPFLEFFFKFVHANDAIDGLIDFTSPDFASITNDAPPTLPVGTTVVTFSVTDSALNTVNATSLVRVQQVFSQPLQPWLPDDGYLTCPIGNFAGADVKTELIHRWRLHSRVESDIRLRIAATSVAPADAGNSIRAAVIDRVTGAVLAEGEVFHPGHPGVGGPVDEEIDLPVSVTPGVDYTLEITTVPLGPIAGGHHYKVGVAGPDASTVELGYLPPALPYLESPGPQFWALHVTPTEAPLVKLSVDVFPHPVEATAVPDQATLVEYDVYDRFGNIVASSFGSMPIGPAADVFVALPPPAAATTYFVGVSANGHYELEKPSDPDPGLYALDCTFVPRDPVSRLEVGPGNSERATGTSVTLTATATLEPLPGDLVGPPAEGVEVTFTIQPAGPHAGLTGVGTTDANGEAAFTYTGTDVGVDAVEASIGPLLGNLVFVEWKPAPVVTIEPAVDDNGAPITDGTVTGSRSATFTVASDDPTATPTCSLDGAPVSCTTPLADLAEGPHFFEATATNDLGGVGTASLGWTVDLSPPVITVDGVDGHGDPLVDGTLTSSTQAQFAVSTDDPGATLLCFPTIAGSIQIPCDTVIPVFDDGPHQFRVTATDLAGNVSTVTLTWLVDTTPPDVTVTPAHDGNGRGLTEWGVILTSSRTAKFTVVSEQVPPDTQTGQPEPVPAVCLLDDVEVACDTSGTLFSTQFDALPDGLHTFEAIGTDPAGNVGTHGVTWEIDATAPVVTIAGFDADGNPLPEGGVTAVTSAQFDITVDDPNAAIACALTYNLVSPSNFSLPCDVVHQNIGFGLLTFWVRADDGTDYYGNVAIAGFTWTVDTLPPNLILPTDIEVAGDALGSAVVPFEVAAQDYDGIGYVDVDPLCTPASGSTFSLGVTLVTCTAVDAVGNSTSGSFTVTVLDVTGPVVTLLGLDPATVEAGDAFSDPGATASDAVDGDVTESIIVTGSVDTSTVGLYERTYTAWDNSDNPGSATRTVNVVDTTPP